MRADPDIVNALRPLYGGDPDDLDLFVDGVVDHMVRSANETAAAVLIKHLPRFRVSTFGPKAEESDTFYERGRRGTELHYWCRVEYPTTVTLTGKFWVDVGRRWAEAVRETRSGGAVPPLPPAALSIFVDALVEAIERHIPEILAPDIAESVEDAMGQDPIRGIDTEATMSSVDCDGAEDKHAEAASVDARFRLRVEREKTSVDVTTYPADGRVDLRIELPIRVELKRIVSPFDSGYMRPGA